MDDHTFLIRFLRRITMLVAIFLVIQTVSIAQPRLNFKRIDAFTFPDITLYVTVKCNGEARLDLKKENFTIRENGKIVTDFEVICPDPLVHCCISVALVIDKSLSMQGNKIQRAKEAAKVFVDMMDGVCDEATLVSFGGDVVVDVFMTTDKTLLKKGIDGLVLNFGTLLWDGTYAGISELVNNGVNECRAVILLTDGRPYGNQQYTLADCIALAQANKIRVFAIGLGNNVNEPPLQQLARETGGTYYYSPSGDDLVDIYKEISTVISQYFQECEIQFQSTCPDGSTRTLEVTVGSPVQLQANPTLGYTACPGTDTKVKIFKAPYDPSQFEDIDIKLGEVTVTGGGTVDVPLVLDTFVDDVFNKATFTVLFDNSCSKFNKITTKNHLLDGVLISWKPVSGGIEFKMESSKRITGQGVLAMLTFEASDPDWPVPGDVCCELVISSWKFEAGCLNPVLHPGKICIEARRPDVECFLEMPDRLDWDRFAKDYNPNPFIVQVQLTNNGNRIAENGRATITVNKKDFALVSPQVDIQPTTPVDIKDGGGTGSARWLLRALRRVDGDSVEVCITVEFDNQDPVKCCRKIWIPPTEPILGCKITVPRITANKQTLKYEPMPFTVTVEVENKGGLPTDTCYATILLEPDLELARKPGNTQIKNVIPYFLGPNQKGTVSWEVTHPITLDMKQYSVKVCVRASNADSVCCEVPLIIPQMEGPRLTCLAAIVDSLVYDEPNDVYVPNPFKAVVSVVNAGTLPADSVRARIILPPDFVLDPPSQNDTLFFNPMKLDSWKPGDPRSELSWTVRYLKKLAQRKCFPIEFEIIAINPVGLPVDPVFCETEVCIPKAGDPKVKCLLIAPDSIVLNPAGTGLTPNPFEIKYIMWNEGRQSSTVSHAQLMFPFNQGITIQAPASGAIMTLNKTLDPGDTLVLTWTIFVSNSKDVRSPKFRVFAYTLDGRDILCEKTIPIAAIKVDLICRAQGPDTLRFNRMTTSYNPNPFKGSFELVNNGGLFLQNVEACIELPQGIELQSANPVQDTCVTIPQIASFRSRTVSWDLILTDQPTVGRTKRIKIRYHSPTLGPDWFECFFDVFVEPSVGAVLRCVLDAPDTIRFADTDYRPDRFNARIGVWNEGTGPADSVRAYLIQDTRFNIIDPRGPNRYLMDLMQPGDSVSTQFLVKVNPRQVSGYDTLRAVVVGVGTVPAVCEYPIWVEKEARPVFDVSCQATPDSLVFDENLNDYVPNPFQVTMIAVNVGDTYADDCKLVFVGPPKFTPVGQDPVINVGRMTVGQSVTHTWDMRALRRTTSGVDTMIFQIQGQGGMGERIVIGECRVPVYVPAARVAEYTLTCTAPNALQYDNGVYIPDPFLLTVDVLNSGGADGRGLKATLQLPSGVELAAGETAVKVLPDVPSQERTQVVWRLRAIARDDTSSVRLCVTVVDTLGQRGECCTDVLIPKADRAQLGLVCSAPQRLEVDPTKGEYIGNPFTVTLEVENQGALQLRNVKATILPQSSEVVVLDQVQKVLALFLDPGAKAGPVEWKVQAQPRTQSGPIEIRIRVSADGLAPKECVVRIEIPELGMPLLACTPWTVPMDTLHFDHSKGAYERDPFEVRLKVWNAGKSQARSVKAMVLPPTGVTLAPGESAIKALTPNTLSVNDSGFVSWEFKPVRMDEGYNRRFVFNVTSDRGSPAICNVTLFVQGAPKISTLTIPRDNVGSFGDKIQVPVYIDETIGKDIRSYRFRIQYDPAVVRFYEAYSKGTLTEYGWITPRSSLVKRGEVEVYDETTGSPLSKGSGPLVYLTFEAVFGGGSNSLKIAQTDLVFTDWDINEGEVFTFVENGLVTVSGECIIPLGSTGVYSLEQNQPNPFNPTTAIRFSIAEDTHVRLAVYDALGREVQVLVDSFKEEGAYSVRFDAGNLPSGIYFYKLETRAFSKIMKMILAR